MQLVLLIALVVVAVGVDASLHIGDSSTITTDEQLDHLMEAVKNHCDATTGFMRRKRSVSQRSEDKVRKLILNVVRRCLEEKPRPETTTWWPQTTQWWRTTTRSTPPPGPCSSPSTLNLTEYWRKDNRGSDIKPGGSYNCDAPMFDNRTWFRITGAAGNVIRNTCSPKYSCGSHGGMWTNASMPVRVGEIRQVAIYGSWQHCTWYPYPTSTPLTVQRCSYRYGDYVYKIAGTTGCNWSVCSMD